MKTKIYFVRHAEPDFSVKDDLMRPLSEKGMGDTKKITISLMDKNITAVYSSPCKRAVDTVKDFASAIGSEIIIKNDFWNIVDKMPYILCFEFDGMNIGGIKEIAI